MVMLFDQFNLPENVLKIVFATEQQQVVAKMLLQFMKGEGGEINKTQMSLFATRLHEGKLDDKDEGKGPVRVKREPLSYNKRQFYDRILTPMKSMGLIDYDLYKKTYRISDKFNKLMMRIGVMWVQEIRNVQKAP